MRCDGVLNHDVVLGHDAAVRFNLQQQKTAQDSAYTCMSTFAPAQRCQHTHIEAAAVLYAMHAGATQLAVKITAKLDNHPALLR